MPIKSYIEELHEKSALDFILPKKIATSHLFCVPTSPEVDAVDRVLKHVGWSYSANMLGWLDAEAFKYGKFPVDIGTQAYTFPMIYHKKNLLYLAALEFNVAVNSNQVVVIEYQEIPLRNMSGKTDEEILKMLRGEFVKLAEALNSQISPKEKSAYSMLLK